MSESSNSAWPFGEISGEEGLDIEAIFKDSTGADQSNPFASPVEAAASDPAPEAQEPPAEPAERCLHRILPQRLLQHPRSLKRCGTCTQTHRCPACGKACTCAAGGERSRRKSHRCGL